MYDLDIRTELKKHLQLEFENSRSIIVDEFKICWGDARIDIAVVNSNLHGYEIKSDNDTLERLPNQIEFYGKIFDTVSIVCTQKWLKKVREIIPYWWGIILVEETEAGIRLKKIRKESVNKKVDVRSVLELTWKEEALEILSMADVKRGFKSKPRWDIWNAIIEIMNEETIKKAVRDCIKARNGWRSSDSLQRLYAD
ncbi:sce7726 family protein [uncultured Phascolarctobacterium sp.]|uniref:sce7726 family protein n=1 Tax=uncultured Phascolarctobacterium sp. TaxID=512296 RepID=UPI0025967510|nr:sce7726 family protein [uncultured Phascolarctobacterium sp.]